MTGGSAGSIGLCVYEGFPNTTIMAPSTLNVTAAFTSAVGVTLTLSATIGSVVTVMESTTTSLGTTTYALTIPANTNLSTISVTAEANGPTGSAATHVSAVSIGVYEIWISYVASTLGSDLTGLRPIVYSGSSKNLVPNGDLILGNSIGYELGNAVYVPANSGVLIIAGGSIITPTFQVQPGNTYRIQFTCGVSVTGSFDTYHRIYYGTAYIPNVSDVGGVLGYVGYRDFFAGSIAAVAVSASMYKIKAGAAYRRSAKPRTSRSATDDADATDDRGVSQGLCITCGRRKHPRPDNPAQRLSTCSLSRFCKDSSSARPHRSCRQHGADRILDGWNAGSKNPLLTLRRAAIPSSLISPAMSLLGPLE